MSVKNLCVLLITGSDNFAQFREQLLALFRSCSQDLVCIYLLTEKIAVTTAILLTVSKTETREVMLVLKLC